MPVSDSSVWRRIAVMWLVCAVVFVPMKSHAQLTFDVPQVDSAMLIVADTGQVLFKKGEDVPMPPASLAKMMTMLLTLEALESGELRWDEQVRVSDKAAAVTGSKVWLASGDRLTVEQLLWAVSIQSANDASIALAERVAGTEEAFVARMNQRAQALGMHDSFFTNSHGLPNSVGETVLSVRDAITVAQQLVTRFPVVLQWTAVWNKPLGPGTRNPIVLENTNRLVLNKTLGVDGLKTGFTSEAGYQLVATAEENGLRLVSAVMRADTADDRYDATERLLRYGFNSFDRVAVGAGDAEYTVTIPQAAKASGVHLESPVSVLVPRNQAVDLTTRVELADNVQAPVTQGEHVGELVINVGGQIVMQVPVFSNDDVARAGVFRRGWQSFTGWVGNLFGGRN